MSTFAGLVDSGRALQHAVFTSQDNVQMQIFDTFDSSNTSVHWGQVLDPVNSEQSWVNYVYAFCICQKSLLSLSAASVSVLLPLCFCSFSQHEVICVSDYKFRKDEIFKRMKVTTFAQLVSPVSIEPVLSFSFIATAASTSFRLFKSTESLLWMIWFRVNSFCLLLPFGPPCAEEIRHCSQNVTIACLLEALQTWLLLFRWPLR